MNLLVIGAMSEQGPTTTTSLFVFAMERKQFLRFHSTISFCVSFRTFKSTLIMEVIENTVGSGVQNSFRKLKNSNKK